MPIILAIEPDRRQRDALAAVVRQRVGAELILADTTERALEAIGNRVPDLVLVPALLSPQDDAALAAALRVIAAAAHVRTLTIPVLAAHTEAAPSSGLLSRWRRGRSASPAPDGCDPAVFAEQISSYLKESAAERVLMLANVGDDRPISEPEYAQEFTLDEEPVSANADIHAEATAYAQPDVQAYFDATVGAGVETAPQYIQSDVEAHARPDVQVSVEKPVETYVDTYDENPVETYVQAYVESPVEAGLKWDDVNAVPYVEDPQPDEPSYLGADVQEEVVAFTESDEPETEYAGSDGLSALQLNQEEDIDLSDELAELEAEEFDGTRRDSSEMELFDGEPVGVYTMDFVIDEPDVDVSVLEAREAFAEVEAAVEPVSAAEAIALSEFESDGPVDPEFFADSFAEPLFDAEPDQASSAFEAGAAAGEPVVDDVNPDDAEPEPADAEPWSAAFLSPRWSWPAMEGVPTEPPAAIVAAEAAVAEARPAPAPHKTGRPEWSELVASLRKDIERRRVEPPQDKPKPNAPSPVHVPRRSRQSKPVQDEWGFFDPEQCGFAALLAKLDEITEGAEDTPVHQPSVHHSS